MFESYFIQYKFIIPNSVKHSSYTYQKIFRALYGYTQQVSKSNGKTYNYHRQGVLSSTPYIRPGKNCVVVPKEGLSNLIDFFKTGKNPAHHWEKKGDWKAVYYMDEKNLDEDLVVKAMENLLDRSYIPAEIGHAKLVDEIDAFFANIKAGQENPKGLKELLLQESKRIAGLPWFQQTTSKSAKLKAFSQRYNELRNR